MKKELDEQLCKEYPKIFAQRNLPMSQTCMCWGFDCGDGWYVIIDALCGQIQGYIDQQHKTVDFNTEYHEMRNAALNGDWSLFEARNKRAYEDLEKWGEWLEREKQRLLDEPPEWFNDLEKMRQVEATQVKEKFGGLRFYINAADDYVSGLTAMAEAMSYRICEDCGKPGKLRTDRRWIRTLCDEHATERDGPATQVIVDDSEA